MTMTSSQTYNAGDILTATSLTKHVTEATPTVLTAALDANSQDVTAMDELGFADLGAASVAGRLRRNSTKLTWHNGTAAGNLAMEGDAVTFAPPSNSGSAAFQAVAGDATLGAGYGSSTSTAPVYAGGVMGNVIGSNLTGTANIIGGVIGKYSITGTNASTYPQAGVIGEVDNNTTTADAAVMAVLGGDSSTTTAPAAFAVDILNSSPSSGFAIGLDLYRASHDSYMAAGYSTAAIRVPNASWIVGRNAADNANVNLVRVTSGNAPQLGLFTFPTSDGTSGQVLQTNGSGTLSFSAGVPSGAIVFISSGTCSGTLGSGWSEYTTARGRFIVGVPASGTLEGTAGSAMTNLQNPSVTPTFSGSALATHQHGVPHRAPSTTFYTYVDLYGSTSSGTSSTNSVATAADAGASNVDLSQAVSGGTPAGTVSAVASNSLAPYIQLMLCKKD